ncbi:hypothetical protein EDD90_0221 [Streptomyces sp. Ag109_O5-1]|uniref:hypothetical protein n=1 Tax=Streptomyces sp. Ag109_O5-1 TaxID=1938851 RepID=UPI000F4F6A8F|nr:hypothetical protein [Streptomyces sp. Ag109_O5-1]RPE37383.1 hypothetical protein EDD90_0221 [Streptomyces sp. Ag109_O5-1]
MVDDEIQEIFERAGCEGAMLVRSAADGAEFGLRADELVVPASVIGAFLRGYPGLQAGEETKLLRSRAEKAGSPPGRTGVRSHEPADGHKLT